MIFQATWQAVLDGTKTETRRICKPGLALALGTLGVLWGAMEDVK